MMTTVSLPDIDNNKAKQHSGKTLMTQTAQSQPRCSGNNNATVIHIMMTIGNDSRENDNDENGKRSDTVAAAVTMALW